MIAHAHVIARLFHLMDEGIFFLDLFYCFGSHVLEDFLDFMSVHDAGDILQGDSFVWVLLLMVIDFLFGIFILEHLQN